jgi:hypothetical protein
MQIISNFLGRENRFFLIKENIVGSTLHKPYHRKSNQIEFIQIRGHLSLEFTKR